MSGCFGFFACKNIRFLPLFSPVVSTLLFNVNVILFFRMHCALLCLSLMEQGTTWATRVQCLHSDGRLHQVENDEWASSVIERLDYFVFLTKQHKMTKVCLVYRVTTEKLNLTTKRLRPNYFTSDQMFTDKALMLDNIIFNCWFFYPSARHLSGKYTFPCFFMPHKAHHVFI